MSTPSSQSTPSNPSTAATSRIDAEVAVGTFRLQVALDLRPGEITAVVGPNGAGKSTLLRTLAGLAPVARGTVAVGGELVDAPAEGIFVPADRRRAGVVFQDYRLLPHLDVRANVGFSRRAQGARRAVAAAAAEPWLEQLELTELADRRPAQLSGGQAQRVALARALASEPALLLLDEPMAALDPATRTTVRGSLRRHLRTFRGPVLMVTHDPIDALALAHRIVVLESGRVVQDDRALDVARFPATEYVARLVGMNRLTGVRRADGVHLTGLPEQNEPIPAPDVPGVDPAQADQRLAVAFRPSATILTRGEIPDGRHGWVGAVASIEPHGDRVRVALEVPAADPLTVLTDLDQVDFAALDPQPGETMTVHVDPAAVEVYADGSAAAGRLQG